MHFNFVYDTYKAPYNKSCGMMTNKIFPCSTVIFVIPLLRSVTYRNDDIVCLCGSPISDVALFYQSYHKLHVLKYAFLEQSRFINRLLTEHYEIFLPKVYIIKIIYN